MAATAASNAPSPLASRAPIGFEAEFVGHRGFPMLYRGILMPFSSDGDDIDYIYGVINWKEMVEASAQSVRDWQGRLRQRRALPVVAAPIGTRLAAPDPAGLVAALLAMAALLKLEDG